MGIRRGGVWFVNLRGSASFSYANFSNSYANLGGAALFVRELPRFVRIPGERWTFRTRTSSIRTQTLGALHFSYANSLGSYANHGSGTLFVRELLKFVRKPWERWTFRTRTSRIRTQTLRAAHFSYANFSDSYAYPDSGTLFVCELLAFVRKPRSAALFVRELPRFVRKPWGGALFVRELLGFVRKP
jgi:hypothetical protein